MECPSCRQIGDFPVNGLSEIDIRDPKAPPAEVPIFERRDKDMILAAGMSSCRLCASPVMLILEGRFEVFVDVLKTVNKKQFPVAEAIRRNNEVLRLVQSYPQAASDRTDRSYPDRVNELLKDLNAARKGGVSPPSRIGMCRSVIDVATRHLLGGEEDKKKLIARIDQLRDRGEITQALADYAHQLRMDGNAAIHESEGSAEDADDLERFLHLFLDVTFGLPDRLKTRRFVAMFEDLTQGDHS